MDHNPLARQELHHADGRAVWVYGAPVIDTGWASPDAASSRIEQRRDPLSDTWLAVASARNERPAGDDGCPLCPGGAELPFPFGAAVFENRFPTLRRDAPSTTGEDLRPATGRCEVVVYTDAHEGSLATLPPAVVARTVAVWRDRSRELWRDSAHQVVLPFENHGAEVGATMPHPHGQIYAFTHVPPFVAQRLGAARRHRRFAGTCLHCETAEQEAAGPRVIEASEHFVVSVPFAPRWPYETRIHARDHGIRRLEDLDDDAATDLARILQHVTRRFDALFVRDLPYLLSIQDAPRDGDDHHLLVELLPPHRSATQLKVRASIETFAGYFINDTRPELTAEHLRAAEIDATGWDAIRVPDVHPTAEGRPA